MTWHKIKHKIKFNKSIKFVFGCRLLSEPNIIKRIIEKIFKRKELDTWKSCHKNLRHEYYDNILPLVRLLLEEVGVRKKGSFNSMPLSVLINNAIMVIMLSKEKTKLFNYGLIEDGLMDQNKFNIYCDYIYCKAWDEYTPGPHTREEVFENYNKLLDNQ